MARLLESFLALGNEGGVRPDGMHDGSLDFRALIKGSKLGIQTFVEGQRGDFGAGVVNDASGGDKRRSACYADDVTLFLLDHVGQEGLDGPVMRIQVYAEDLLQVFWGGLHDGFACADTGVVDDDGRVSNAALDFGGDFHDSVVVAHITLEKGDFGIVLQMLGQFVQIKRDNVDSLCGEVSGIEGTETAGAASDNSNLLIPVPSFSGARKVKVVICPLAQVVVGSTHKTGSKEPLQHSHEPVHILRVQDL